MRRLYHYATSRLYDPRIERFLKETSRGLPTETPSCILCNGNQVVKHLNKFGFQVVSCAHDGLLFVSPRPSELQPFYGSNYYVGALPGLYTNYDTCARSLEREWTKRLESLEEGEGRRLLDVGCATGAFLQFAQDRGWTVTGIELSEWGSDVARRRGLEVLTGSLPHDALESGTFDAVTLWDCVEHLADPAAVLNDVYRVLRTGGRVMLSTGAVPHRDPQGRSVWYFPPWHLYYFSVETITALLEKAGFSRDAIHITEKGQPWALMVVTAHRP
jgi:SAM-dependent methyltransferase